MDGMGGGVDDSSRSSMGSRTSLNQRQPGRHAQESVQQQHQLSVDNFMPCQLPKFVQGELVRGRHAPQRMPLPGSVTCLVAADDGGSSMGTGPNGSASGSVGRDKLMPIGGAPTAGTQPDVKLASAGGGVQFDYSKTQFTSPMQAHRVFVLCSIEEEEQAECNSCVILKRTYDDIDGAWDYGAKHAAVRCHFDASIGTVLKRLKPCTGSCHNVNDVCFVFDCAEAGP